MNAPEFEGKSLKSITQGGADLAQFAKTDAPKDESEAESADKAGALADLIAFAKEKLADAVADVRSSERLTESAVCLVASEGGYDRQMEKILQGAGQLPSAAKPVLELNPDHSMVRAIAAQASDAAFREDAVHLLLDQARVLDGDKPSDPRAFAERLQRVFERASRA